MFLPIRLGYGIFINSVTYVEMTTILQISFGICTAITQPDQILILLHTELINVEIIPEKVSVTTGNTVRHNPGLPVPALW